MSTWNRISAAPVWFLLVSLAALSTCIQPVNEHAVDGVKTPPLPPGGHTESLTTPPIEIDFSHPPATTTRACDLTARQAMTILTAACASCHGGRTAGENKGTPPFDFVLDTAKLLGARSITARDPTDPTKGMRFLVSGDPDGSRLYLLMAGGTPPMPPPFSSGQAPMPAPTVSDLSLLRQWITSCLGPAGAADAAVPTTPADAAPEGGRG